MSKTNSNKSVNKISLKNDDVKEAQNNDDKKNNEDFKERMTEWCDGFENVLKKEAEQSESLFWLHNKASIYASRNNDLIQIPSIILQTVTGFLNATGLVTNIALGSISIFTGILSTLLSYYKFSARAEGHRVVAQLYMKIFKNIEVELSLPINQRAPPQLLLKDVRDKLARISEVAPDIPNSIIKLYNNTFKDNKTAKPIITNGLDEINIYKDDMIPTPPPKINIKVTYPNKSS